MRLLFAILLAGLTSTFVGCTTVYDGSATYQRTQPGEAVHNRPWYYDSADHPEMQRNQF